MLKVIVEAPARKWYLMMMDQIVSNIAISLPGFLLAIVVHEWAHARMALHYGDQTARLAGRLTFNPGAHYDLIGTVVFPMIGILFGGIPFGWAKPVPVDPRRFANVRQGIFWVSFAGPLANIVLALVSAVLFAFFFTQVPTTFYLQEPLTQMLSRSVFINAILAFFNLIPFPPLDGSKMVSTFMNYDMARKYEALQNYSFIFIIILITTDIFSYLFQPVYIFSRYFMHYMVQVMG